MTFYSTGHVIMCCPLNPRCLTAYLCGECNILKLAIVGMHCSLAKQDTFPEVLI
jgi:hypothetical protein